MEDPCEAATSVTARCAGISDFDVIWCIDGNFQHSRDTTAKYNTNPQELWQGAPNEGGDNLRADDQCKKFYAQYTERRQTGGIMAAWCPHMICLGFHNIPRAEGRNDVFSVMLTRSNIFLDKDAVAKQEELADALRREDCKALQEP